MAKLIIDFSGNKGLVERYHGDLDGTTHPNLRYTGADGEFADGLFNPIRNLGYISPANGTFTDLTGTIGDEINAVAYDSAGDVAYFSENTTNILKLDTLSDTSLTNWVSVNTGDFIHDILKYEMNGSPAILWVQDNGSDFAVSESSGTIYGGIRVGYKSLDGNFGTDMLTIDTTTFNQTTIQGSVSRIIDDGTNHSTKLTQSFNTEDFDILDANGLITRDLSGVSLPLLRIAGTGVGITIKVSVQGNADRNTAPYTYIGAWADSTAYSVDDTVEYTSVTYQCVQAHTSVLITNRPSDGNAWEEYWEIFAAPDESDIASGTFTLSDLDDGSEATDITAVGSLLAETVARTRVEFSSIATLATDTQYWLVVEESGASMTSSDQMGWVSTTSTNNPYVSTSTDLTFQYGKAHHDFRDATTPSYISLSLNGTDTGHNQFLATFVLNTSEWWSTKLAVGRSGVDSNTSGVNFLMKADNGYAYWFSDNRVHRIDGGITGGTTGTFTPNILIFPSYLECVDAVDTRGKMYLGIQSSQTSADDDDRSHNADVVGVYIWDKLSAVTNFRDFVECRGAREIKKIFIDTDGSVQVITVGDDKFVQIRQLVNGEFRVIKTLGKDAYPAQRHSTGKLNNLSYWLGSDGVFYLYGSTTPMGKNSLYKFGDMSAEPAGALTTGIVFTGYEDAASQNSRVVFSYLDGSTAKLSSWFPNGTGTINTVAQKPAVGNPYTKVYSLPSLDTVRYIRGFHIPGGAGGATTKAKVSCYINQKTTAEWTLNISQDDIQKGWFEKEWNKPGVNFLQFKVEYITTETLGDEDYRPMYFEVEYGDEGRINR